jgi:hypothetical protein
MVEAPEHFEVMDGYCSFRLLGHGPLIVAASKVIEVITYARENGIRKLLVDTTGWTGHTSPSTIERYHVAEEFAHAARSAVKVAMVVRPELMDPNKFEVTVAENRRMDGNVFDSECEALAWLVDSPVQ